MAIINYSELLCRINCVSVFRGVIEREEMVAFADFLRAASLADKMWHYGKFVNLLGKYAGSFSEFLKTAVFEDENVYVTAKAKGRKIPSVIEANCKKELELFSLLTNLDTQSLFEDTNFESYIPTFENERLNFAALYSERVKDIGRYGYGIFASNCMFKVEDGEIVPVKSADGIGVETFIGYERERQQVIDNTRALTEGRPAANVLLCGDAGTGKSSTVKAVANMFFNQGVRLIEIRKDQLFSLSHIMGKIADNPLKFIIFIDDLSFNKNDDCFSMLKAALEGSASAQAPNAVIYATSNRRHIVKESFSDRSFSSDDIHHSDTVQELLSLSDRFGLVVYFSKPSKALYLSIVNDLAKRTGITMDKAEIELKAEQFALAKGSRSPRAALQFINSLL